MAKTISPSSSIMLSDYVDQPPLEDGLLAGLSPDAHDALRAAGTEITIAVGDHVFRQGEPHDGIFFLMEGSVRSYFVAPNGREITLALWTPPNFVGGPKLFGGGEHQWSGEAVADSRLLFVPGAELKRLANDVPGLAINLLDGLVGKAEFYSVVLQMLGTRSVTQRFAYYIMVHSTEGDDGLRRLDAKLSQADIASIVGATRQWVSSMFDRLSQKGILQTAHGGDIIIRNPRALQEIAES